MGASRKGSAAIVVTCFNDRETLPETIASIRRDATQTELVVVDDGSTDTRTLAVLDELEQQGVRVLHQPNGGQARAAMAGVEATSAPYVMRFDADDLLEPGAIDLLVEALDRTPGAAAAWGDVQTVGLTNFRIPGIPALDPWLVTHTNCMTGSGTLMRRSALTDVGGWQLRKGFEDWDVWMGLAERGYTGIYVPGVVFCYRRDGVGALAGWLPQTPSYYDELRGRHPALFAARRENRRSSAAPLALKLAVMMVEALPLLGRLTRIQLNELFTRLLWSGGLRQTATMAVAAFTIRVRRA